MRGLNKNETSHTNIQIEMFTKGNMFACSVNYTHFIQFAHRHDKYHCNVHMRINYFLDAFSFCNGFSLPVFFLYFYFFYDTFARTKKKQINTRRNGNETQIFTSSNRKSKIVDSKYKFSTQSSSLSLYTVVLAFHFLYLLLHRQFHFIKMKLTKEANKKIKKNEMSKKKNSKCYFIK